MMGQLPRSRTMMGLVGKLMILCLMGAKSQAPAAAPPGADDDCQLEISPDVRVCQDEFSTAFADTSDVQIRWHNESAAYMSGTYILLKGIPDNAMLTVDIKKVNSHGNVPMFTHKVCSMCEELAKPDGDLTVVEPLNLGLCPIKAGEYEIINMPMDTSNMPIIRIYQGMYMGSLEISSNTDGSCKNGEPLACVSFSFRIECM